ncbi:MAG: lysophospholipid acyltransferase family protein [Actinomycetota bacterium]|nr:lysophospholipid acyltransferase family protein [Actinomycetota bacterium]
MTTRATRTAPRQLTDLIDREALSPELRDLLGPQLHLLVGVAALGDRASLHDAERAWAKAAVSTLDVDIDITGFENIDPGRRYIVAPLHEGFADVLALLNLPLNLNWVVRDELLELPFFGTYLQAAGHIAIEPELPRAAFRRILEGAGEMFAADESLVVFPQGSVLGLDVSFMPGAFRLAEHFGLPVLPVVLTGSHRVWEYPFTTALRRGQKVRMEVLESIEPEAAISGMRTLERDMKRRALAATDAPARRYEPERDGYWKDHSFLIDPDLPGVAVATRP